MDQLEREAIRLTAMLSAAEDWAPLYFKTPKQHAQLIQAEARMQVALVRLFRSMQRGATAFVNWDMYGYQSRLDYNLDVIVNEHQIDQNDGLVIKVTVNTVQDMAAAGFTASELLAGAPQGLPSTSALIQKLAIDQVAALVGKTVKDDGTIIDNPNAEYNIIDTVRNDIVQAVKTSLGLGETTEEAIARMRQVINPEERAALIAQTESVNAYQAGVMGFGGISGAVGKQWYDAGAKDLCLQNTQAGPIAFRDAYPTGVMAPTQHPRCRCSQRLIYAEEWAAIRSGHPYEVVTGIV